MNWIDACAAQRLAGTPMVLVSVFSVAGSTPRQTDAKMVVTAEQHFDSIGGGVLEHHAIEHARGLLRGTTQDRLISQTLGPSTGQCCGGKVQLLFELLQYPGLVIFGGGHVSQALATILDALPYHTTVVDSRPEYSNWQQGRIHAQWQRDPIDWAHGLCADKVLIMTHDHQQDAALLATVLQHSDCPWIGVIGSSSKAAKFRSQMQKRNLQHHAARWHMPIGSKLGKQPMQIAVAIAAALLGEGSAATLTNSTHTAVAPIAHCGDCRRCDALEHLA